MSLKDDYDTLRRLHDATNLAVIDLQKKNTELLETNNLHMQNLINCQQALDITKENMRNALTEQNRIKDQYAFEINELRAKIKAQG